MTKQTHRLSKNGSFLNWRPCKRPRALRCPQVADYGFSSDADSDVLADYVIALVKSEDSDEQVRRNCLENLPDFLRDSKEFLRLDLRPITDMRQTRALS